MKTYSLIVSLSVQQLMLLASSEMQIQTFGSQEKTDVSFSIM